MTGSLYDNGLAVFGLWVATGLVMLFLWGLLAWAVVSILSRQGFGRRGAGTTDYRGSRHMCHTVADDSRRLSRCGPDESGDPTSTPQPDFVLSCPKPNQPAMSSLSISESRQSKLAIK
jgi:hypothetical protein